MPFGDGTGPRGMGSMTGRGAGYCVGSGQSGFTNPLPGREWFNFGFGRRSLYGYPPTLVLTIRCGHVEVAGVAAGVVGAAGAGLHLIGTSGSRTTS